jgi:pyruvate dehydrogenase E2 component (dihydrolipoamide acetyltransferase)
MADIIRMPLLSDTMTEGKITVWNKKVGDSVKADDSLADVETDKATMEIIPYVDGTLLYIGVEAGKAAKVNDIIAILGKPGEDISTLLSDDSRQLTENTNTQSSDGSSQMATNTITTSLSTDNRQPTTILPKDLTVIRMPLLSDTMTEGKIVVWNKNVGDLVKADDSLADVETDKATMEVIGYTDGTLLYKGVEAGKAAKINEVIAVIGKAGTDITPYLALLKMPDGSSSMPNPISDISSPVLGKANEAMSDASNSVSGNTNAIMNDQTKESEHRTSNIDNRLKASPLAKSIAHEKGINLADIQGSGDGGRIVKRDIDSFKAMPVASTKTATNIPVFAAGIEGHTDTQLTQMRKIIAQRLSDSMFTAPHFYLKISVEMDQLMNARKQINALADVKISVNDMLIKACAMSLAKHPDINSSFMGDFIRHHHHINIGTAIALPDGLIVPVLKFANQKTLSQIAVEANELYDKARNKKIQPSEFTGNTFTISNLGMMGIDEFTAIINPPDACILAVGRTAATPVVVEGQVVIKNIMKLTLSCDHRVVDGAVGAEFLQTLKGYLENPIGMLV